MFCNLKIFKNQVFASSNQSFLSRYEIYNEKKGKREEKKWKKFFLFIFLFFIKLIFLFYFFTLFFLLALDLLCDIKNGQKTEKRF